jgi:pimeloyl-ACP methyl ester carboxylesterase
MTQTDIAVTTGDAAPARPRRWWRRLLVTAVVLVLLLAVATAGVGYYFAGQLVTVDHSPAYEVKVEALHGDEITLSRDVNTELPVLLGLVWPGGAARLGATVRVTGDTVVRTVTSVVRGTLRVGLDVAVDRNVYDTDPKEGRGLDYQTVSVPGELGPMPAWYVPPTAPHPGTTWVIAVHGRDATRQESLRILPTIAAAGLPALVVTYRNDEGAPASPDRYYHLGATEWRDLVAAIGYARAHGATAVVLYGWSMGGGMAMMALRRLAPADAALVRAVVLDSPVLSWNAVIDLQGSQRYLPGFVIWSAKRFTEWRTGLSLRDLDQLPYAADLRVPVLLFVDEAERHVPTGPAHEFARARPDLVTLVSTTGGGHVASWNVDPARYESAVTSFLGRVG